MRVGTKVAIVETGEHGEVVQARKFIGCPYQVRLESGGLFWCGPYDVQKVAP